MRKDPAVEAFCSAIDPDFLSRIVCAELREYYETVSWSYNVEEISRGKEEMRKDMKALRRVIGLYSVHEDHVAWLEEVEGHGRK